jgi:mutator protein MutT
MKLDFCPTCGAALTAANPTVYHCQNGHEYYNNPRAGVAIILTDGQGNVLFARRGREPQKGKCDFPGGFVDFNENAPEAAVRELHEELDITPDSLELIGTVKNAYDPLTSTVDCIYLCPAWQGELTAQDDVAALEWHPIDFLRSDEFAWASYQSLYDNLAARLTVALEA